ncbi:unnamed protein product [Mucor hiemalis]
MEAKVTRHTSTNLEELEEKIALLLKDPSEALTHASVNIDSMTLTQLKEFAENGGLGACVSKADVLATTPEELMYLQGERIIVLKHIENDIYMGYCEGVFGNFNAESVHFVELDPRVLESLDADIDFTDNSLYRNSTSSHGTDLLDRQYNNSFNNIQMRDSLHSYSSGSDNIQLPPQSSWISKPSFESIGTNSSISMSQLQHSHLSNQSFTYSTNEDFTNIDDRIINRQDDPYDTSAFNIDYSDEDDIDQVYNQNIKQTTRSIPKKQYPKSNSTFNDVESNYYSQTTNNNSSLTEETSTTPKYSNNTQNMSVDEYGFIIKADGAKNKNLRSGNQRPSMSPKSMKEYRENELKWLSIVNKLDAGTVKKDAKMKKLVRSGIPASVRSKVWQFLAGSNDYRKQGQFNALVSKQPTKIYEVIEKDIARCYPDHTQFMDKNGQGQKDIGCVLKAYSQYNSQLEYCQGMGRLAGLMLMQMTLEDSFWLLVATIDRYMNGYFTPTLSQLRIDAYIIGQLLKDHNPKLAQHLEDNDVLPIMYIAQWFLTAFTMTLPWESVLRVWDAFYFEGIKVFYRVSLAIMDICKGNKYKYRI